MNEESAETPTIHDAVSEFIHDLEGVKSAEQIACPLIQAIANESRNRFKTFAEGFQTDTTDDQITYRVPFESSREFRKLQRRTQRIQGAIYHTPRALLVAMVSAFDAYLGRLSPMHLCPTARAHRCFGTSPDVLRVGLTQFN
jgi:hypothetical protein